jgi:hypothetical protein
MNDYLGAEGGRLAVAFATGCIGTFAFMAATGRFIWGIIGKTREDRITELSNELAEERRRCNEMEIRLNDRISQLETVLLYDKIGQVRQNTQIAISDLSRQIRERGETDSPEKDGS